MMDGKSALVTGAGSGIGRASALAFAEAGAKVLVTDVDTRAGEETAHEIARAGGEALFQRLNVTVADDAAAAVQRAVQEFGRLDCAHNNAGTEGTRASSQGTLGTSEEEWDRLLAINLKGVWLCMRAEIIAMLESDRGGAIVNTSSISGLVGSTAGFVAYSASKHGILGLTKSASLEFARKGIRINAVCPGYIETPLWNKYTEDDPEMAEAIEKRQPIGRMGTAKEVADAVVWLCSDAASLVTGIAMPLDGGFTAQ